MGLNEFMLRVGLVSVITGFAALYTWLLIDTWNADELYVPNDPQLYLTPALAGALALGLAVQLGVDPGLETATDWWGRLRRLFRIKSLLGIGSLVYLAAAVGGVFVWAKNLDETPELVTALVLTAAGYLAAAYSAAARGGG